MRVALPLAFLALACEGPPPGSDDSAALSARFVDSSPGRAAVAIEGLYYGELEIVAYDYRPDDAVQTNASWGAPSGGGDWSYWVTLQNGREEARDVLLTGAGEIEFEQAAEGQAMAGQQPPDDAFVAAVGAFDIDFYEVMIFRPGLIHAGEYYGWNADLDGIDTHPLHNYPDYDGIPDHLAHPVFPGFVDEEASTGQSHSVLFARDDWFPEPVLVYLGLGQPYAVQWSSVPLDADQTATLESLVNQGTNRRFYDSLVVVPIPGPVRIVLDADVAAALPASPVTLASPVEVTVGYDLSHSLDDVSDFLVPQVVFAGDANHVPFGITAAFAEAGSATE